MAAASTIGAPGRILLVRQRGRRSAGLSDLAHLGLHQETDVARDLAQDAGVDAAVRDERAKPVSLRVPRRVGAGEPQLLSEPWGDVEPAIAERGQRAGRATELDTARRRSPA